MDKKMILEFDVIKQCLIRRDSNKPVEGSENYLYAKFKFSSDYEGLNIKAKFENNGVIMEEDLNEDNMCIVPAGTIHPSLLSVSILGYSTYEKDDEGKPIVKITTNIENIRIYETIGNANSNSNVNVKSNAIIDVETLPKGTWKGTTVPNSGTLEKVYFNENLTAKECVEILSKLSFNAEMDNMYLLYATSDGSNALMIMKSNDYVYFFCDQNQTLIAQIAYLNDETQVKDFTFSNPIELNIEVISEMEGILIGEQNELLNSMFSITPFTYEVEGLNSNSFYRTPDGSIYQYNGVFKLVSGITSQHLYEYYVNIFDSSSQTYDVKFNLTDSELYTSGNFLNKFKEKYITVDSDGISNDKKFAVSGYFKNENDEIVNATYISIFNNSFSIHSYYDNNYKEIEDTDEIGLITVNINYRQIY